MNENIYDVTVVERAEGKPDLRQTSTAGAKATAAWLRAWADLIDPPKPALRREPAVRVERSGSGTVNVPRGLGSPE